jgi:pyruvate kinase
MSHTKIITTIGPSSLSIDTLKFFKQNNVEFARLNFSHSASDWHLEAAKVCRGADLKILMDLGGPKIRLGVLHNDTDIKTGEKVVLENYKESLSYPFHLQSGEIVLPVAVDISTALKKDRIVLVDDGKLALKVEKIEDYRVFCVVETGGIFKSRKGVNLPKSSLQISFLTDRDKSMITETLAEIKPEVVACSFVKTKADIEEMKNFISKVIQEQNIDPNYFPKICCKLEQHELFVDNNLEEIIQDCDIIMIARGDLALEVTPTHLVLPFLQEKIIQVCKKYNKPFVVATQILESMIDCPVPTRAEVSDLYRAVMLDKADFIMLSGESAMGKYPTQCVKLMNDMITQGENLKKEILGILI